MHKAITHRGLSLEFEACNDGLLLHNYKPIPDYHGEIVIFLKINGNNIECEFDAMGYDE